MNWVARIGQRITGSPFLWGGLATVAFYALIHGNVLRGEAVYRYFCSHPVEYVSMAIFFTAMALLTIKGAEIWSQLWDEQEALLPPVPAGGQAIDEARGLAEQLRGLPERRGRSYRARRLQKALEHVTRRGTASGLEEELKYLSDVDAAAAHAGYSLVRIIIWAIPILGFLGTVMGITIAIANIAPQALEKSMPEVTAGLAVAFDTTALALGLSMILMFAQFLVDRAEQKLLFKVDQWTLDELAGRFYELGTNNDPQLAVVRRMGDAMIQAVEQVVHRQAELWQKTIAAAHERWSRLSSEAHEQLQSSLSRALEESLDAHARRLTEAEQVLAEHNRRHWGQLHQTLAEGTHAVKAQQGELIKQGEVLLRVVEATGQVARLEETLNRNLSSLVGAQQLEQVVLSLSAAIQLLTGRVGQHSQRGDGARIPDVGHAA